MRNFESILTCLKNCNHRCRKCVWRDRFANVCTLFGSAAEYIESLEQDNAKKMVYCKDCIYSKVTKAKYNFENDKYECTNRDGLPIVPYISPMDYCSRGKAKQNGGAK